MAHRYFTLLFASMVWAALPLAAAASGEPHAIGTFANAQANSRDGPGCEQGFEEVEGACAQIAVPNNAYATNAAYGREWECRRGYRRSTLSCVEISVPENAYLTSFGDQWDCDRGFRRVNEACDAVNVPANGFLSAARYGEGWELCT